MITLARICMLILLLALLSACAANTGSSSARGVSKPGTLELQLEESFIAYNDGRLGDSEALLHKILKTHPNLSDAWFKLGNIYYRTGQYDAAVRAYEKTVTYDKENGRAWYNLALTRIKQADIALKIGAAQITSENPYFERLGTLRKKLNQRVSSGES